MILIALIDYRLDVEGEGFIYLIYTPLHYQARVSDLCFAKTRGQRNQTAAGPITTRQVMRRFCGFPHNARKAWARHVSFFQGGRTWPACDDGAAHQPMDVATVVM